MSVFKIFRNVTLFYMLDCWLLNAYFFTLTVKILSFAFIFWLISFIFGDGGGSKYSVVYGQYVPKDWNVY